MNNKPNRPTRCKHLTERLYKAIEEGDYSIEICEALETVFVPVLVWSMVNTSTDEQSESR